ncbi:MAG: hypothetical protein AB2813_04380 [Candidatus Sedimenticola endophacoides]
MLQEDAVVDPGAGQETPGAEGADAEDELIDLDEIGDDLEGADDDELIDLDEEEPEKR